MCSSDLPVVAYMKWMNRIPQVFRNSVLDDFSSVIPSVEKDVYNLSVLKHYRSLMPMAMEARKPMFFLKSSDGAFGAHVEAVRACYRDFFELAQVIAKNAGVEIEQ